MLAMQLQSLLDVGFVCGHIGRIFDARRRVYSAPPIHAELRREGRRQACRRIQSMSRRGNCLEKYARLPSPWPELFRRRIDRLVIDGGLLRRTQEGARPPNPVPQP